MVEILGWLSAILLAFCGLPEVISSVYTGHTSLTWAFLAMWGLGEIFALAYVLIKNRQIKLLPLLFNYGFNLLFISILVYYKL